MKFLFYSLLIAAAFPLSASAQRGPLVTDSLFTHFDAEKIMGQSTQMSDRKVIIGEHSKIYQSAYSTIAADEESGRTGNIYWMVEQFDDAMSAHNSFAGIKKENAMNGIEDVRLGNEAYFHTDEENFCFLMVRKDNVTFRIKVNKLTSKTSVDSLNKVAREIVAKL